MEMIRNSAKALVLKDGRLLLNRCLTGSGEEYFDLPGGGQRVYETMEEAVVREAHTAYLGAVRRDEVCM